MKFMKKGFTLAEVLITLSIIGVVAALTIPTVVRNYRATQYLNSLKSAYSILSNAVNTMNAQEGIIATSEAYLCPTFKPALIKYLKIIKDCGNSGCLNSNNNNYKNYAKNAQIGVVFLDEGQFIMANGMFVAVQNGTVTVEIFLTVDINGLEKGPNAWGHDLFTFQILNQNGRLVPMGTAGTYYGEALCSKTSTSDTNGIACTYKALTDPNYFKNLP